MAGFDLVVELHQVTNPGLTRRIPARFTATHDVTIVGHGGRDVTLPPLFEQAGHLDQLLAVWEWRSGPTPWAVMIRRSEG
ncbi:MAG: hypothetical protein ACR2K5_14390 [Pseudolabrys sp.]